MNRNFLTLTLVSLLALQANAQSNNMPSVSVNALASSPMVLAIFEYILFHIGVL